MKSVPKLHMAWLGLLSLLLTTGVNSWSRLPGPPPPPHVDPDPSNLSQRNITCLGDHTDIAWAMRNEPYNGQSMQVLCASLELRGGTPWGYPNFAASCSGLGGDVIFNAADAHFDNVLWHETQYLRSRLECRTRCFCNHGLENPNEQPKLAPLSRASFPGPVRGTGHDTVHMIRIDKKGYQSIPERGWPNPVTRFFHPANPGAAVSGIDVDVGIAPVNKIQCTGPLPNFNLPAPFTVADFANNQELCAVQLSDGSPHANAGAYCHPLTTHLRSVSFADDMTPRLDWTWAGTRSSFRDSVSIRFHCWKNCLCARPSRKPNFNDPLVPMWDWLLSEKHGLKDVLSIGSGNKFPMGSSTDPKGRPRTSAKGANKPKSQCNVDDPRKCTAAKRPWPEEILGPLPKSLEMLTEVPQSPATQLVEQRQCGNTCEGNEDCGDDCICRIASKDDIKTFGLDPVAQSAAYCLGLASVFGRDEKATPRLEQSQCLCNATYVAPACCESRNGVVH